MASAPDDFAVHEADKNSTREERFMATVYAMNTLLIGKAYSRQDFQRLYVEWMTKEARKKSRDAVAES